MNTKKEIAAMKLQLAFEGGNIQMQKIFHEELEQMFRVEDASDDSEQRG